VARESYSKGSPVRLTALASRSSAGLQVSVRMVLLWLGAVALSVFLIGEIRDSAKPAIAAIKSDHAVTEAPLLPYTDFEMFYAGATLARSGNRDLLYDKPTIVHQILLAQGYGEAEITEPIDTQSPDHIWLRYYNPPAYLFAWAPATFLSVRDAYLVAIGLNIVMLVVLAVLLGFVVRWRMPLTLLLLLGLFGFSPVYFSLHHGQPTILIAGLMAAGYLALRNGREAWAGILLALTGVKPNWLMASVPAMRRRGLLLPFLATCVVFLALPFVLLGPSAVIDYVHLVLDRGDGDLTNSTYGSALLSWSGFFRALTGEPQPLLWLVASIATVAVYARVWLRSGSAVTLAAAVPTFLLIVPHSHPQDWTLMATAAALLLSLRWSPLALSGIALLLFGLLLGANDWIHATRAVERGETQVYWVSLAAAGLLLWLAVLTWIRRDAEMMGSEEMTAVA
jgi:Glycosyltransferase family 87